MREGIYLKIIKYIPVFIILLSFSPILFTYDIGKMSVIYNYIIYIGFSVLVGSYYWSNRKELSRQYRFISFLYAYMIVYVVVSCIKLFFVPSSIYPFVRMQVMCSFLSVGAIFVMMEEAVLIRTLQLWWKYVPIIVLPVSLFMDKFWLISMLKISFLFLILSNCITRNKRYLIICMFIYMASYGIIQRMDYILIITPLIILIMIKFRILIGVVSSKILYGCLMITPLVFLSLALTGKFNVLNMDSYIHETYISASGENMTADTRTLLYQEAISSAEKNDYLWFGRTPGYGYDSYFVSKRKGTFYAKSGVYPQRNSEVFCVNIFTWTGIVGILLWFVFFCFLGFSVLKEARNRYIRALVIYIGFFWICDWISNGFTAPSSTYMLFYIIIAICSQRKFQIMSDLQIEQYFKRIL